MVSTVTFEEEGFLSKETEIAAKQIFAQHRALFEFCSEVNRFACATKRQFSVHNQDRRELTAAILFTRLLEGFQAVYLLSNRGFGEETAVQLRGMLESLIQLALCCDHWEFYSLYLSYTEIKNKLKMVNVASNSPDDEILPSIKEYATPELKQKLESQLEPILQEMKSKGIEKRHFAAIETLARKSGLSPYYNSMYRYLSEAAHSSPESLKTYLKLNHEGDVVELMHGYTDRNIYLYMVSATYFLLNSVEAISQIFDLEKKKETEEYFSRLGKFKESYYR